MSTFLGDAARCVAQRYGKDLSALTLVFPTRRAGLFFEIELKKWGTTPPCCTTIDHWIGNLSELKRADNLSVLAELYKIYCELHGTEPFERWASFGKLLLTDFDSVDKYLVDAQALYSVVSDTREVEAEFRDESYQAALEFWRTFQQAKAEQHSEQEFVRIWRSLFDLYTRLSERLLAKGEGSGGMIYRAAALAPNPTPQGTTIFIGLNALSRSEQVILERTEAEFLWDYDPSWLTATPPHQAAYFITRNLKRLPQAEWFEPSEHATPQIEAIATPTRIGQCKALPALLAELGEWNHKTGIVLTDEGLIVPLVHSLPPEIGAVNISVGYPLRSTAAYGLIERLTQLYTTYRTDKGFYHTALFSVLRHPLIGLKEVADELSAGEERFLRTDTIAAPTGRSATDLNGYLTQILAGIETEIASERYALDLIKAELASLWSRIAAAELPLSVRGYTALLFEALSALRLPYEGHSGQGVQVLGILESRALDFENLIVLSLDDANFPDAHTPSSYIPQTLRAAYGLPSTEEHNAIWSYYFFRLLPRAKNVRLVYCGAGENEPSRYLRQLHYLSDWPFVERSADAELGTTPIERTFEVEKTKEIISSLAARRLSPSALNRYAECPMRFYLSDVAGVKPLDETSEALSPLDTGNILHHALEALYTPFVGKADAARLLQGVDRKAIRQAIETQINKACGSRLDPHSASVGVVRTAVERLVGNVVAYDAARTELFVIQALEHQVKAEWITASGTKVQVGGTIDRLDRLADGSLSIVDYKSGGDKPNYASVEALFDGATYGSRNSAALQLLVYAVVLRRVERVDVSARLYVARKLGLGFDPTVAVSDEVLAEVEARIEGIFEQWSDQNAPFAQTVHRPEFCRYCPYISVCN